MRYAAATLEFENVKLPANTVFPNLKWATRVAMLSFLEAFSFDDLSEAFGKNRSVWVKFFKHVHLFSQKDFVTRFPVATIAARVSVGSNISAFNDKHTLGLKSLIKQGFVEQLGTGNTVYRTFASRVDSAIAEKSFAKLKALFEKNGGYLLRNLMTVSNGISKVDEPKFIELVREKIQTASAGVLFSILGINVDAKYRVIDQKGDTLVTEANYPKFIKDIQGDIVRTIRSRWGFEGQVTVTDSLKDQVVPFLSKNSDLARGTRISFKDTTNLYFFIHWMQKNRRTDLDHSYLAFDDKWNMETVWFGHQANAYITHGGDITNAPAPSGATEYGKVRLKDVPSKIKYIAPVVNVYTGDNFKALAECYAGFSFSDSDQFELARENNRYDLSQPAMVNIPFVIDMERKEVVIVDYNNREQYSRTAHTQGPDLRKIISAYNDKNVITIGKLAAMLSGDKETESLRIRKASKKEGEISPEALASLFV
jgi:stress response protein SCP2